MGRLGIRQKDKGEAGRSVIGRIVDRERERNAEPVEKETAKLVKGRTEVDSSSRREKQDEGLESERIEGG